MLVLTRFKDDDVVLTVNGERVVMRVVDCFGGKVRLGFEAGPAVVIHRGEVQLEIDREADRQAEAAALAAK